MTSPVKLWRNQKYIRALLGRKGKILACSTVFVPPENFSEYAPYPVAVVELNSGEKIVAQVVDCDKDQLVPGQEVLTVLRRVMEPDGDGVIQYGIKVKPLW